MKSLFIVLASVTILHAQPDLIVQYIQRLPTMDYVENASDPQTQGWPTIGQNITWCAFVKNKSIQHASNVYFEWRDDSELVASGTISFSPGEIKQIELPWTWTFERHEIELWMDPLNTVAEIKEFNNDLTIFTDAISLNLYVEKTLYDYFNLHQIDLNYNTNSFEDWAQRLNVKRWNEMFLQAISNETPNGVLDRIRIDRIIIVPDGALPMAGGLASNNPNLNDFSCDLQWGFPASLITNGFYSNTTTASDNNPFFYEGSLLHELGHARYLIDTYGFDISDDTANGDPTILITENEVPIVGTTYMPFINWSVVHYNSQGGFMSTDYSSVSTYDAMAMNLIDGHRATCGNYNAPCNIGVFLNDLPNENHLTITDACNVAIPNANVYVYQAEPKAGVWYGKIYDNIPDITLTTDNLGEVSLGRCPFDDDEIVDHGYGYSNGVVVLRIEAFGQVFYRFLEVMDFNMQYWAGNTDSANYTISVPLDCSLQLVEHQVNYVKAYPNPTKENITFSFGEESIKNLTVYSVTGAVIHQELIVGKYFTLTTQAFASGLYTYSIITDDGTKLSGKFVVY